MNMSVYLGARKLSVSCTQSFASGLFLSRRSGLLTALIDHGKIFRLGLGSFAQVQRHMAFNLFKYILSTKVTFDGPVVPGSHGSSAVCLRSYSVSTEKDIDFKTSTKSVAVESFVPQSHIKGLAVQMGCSDTEMKSLIRDNTFLIHMGLDLVKTKIDLILSYELPLSFVRQHVSVVYQKSNSELERRLEAIKECGLLHSPFLEVEKLPHLLECTISNFQQSLKYWCDQRDALEGCADQQAYLQMRLGCPERTAKAMLCSYPLERHISNMKLKTLLDFFLIEAERSPDFVVLYRKLMTFSPRRLQNRWAVIRRAGLESEAKMVYVWSMSQKDFVTEYAEYLEVSSI